jgi:CRP-like cAMP-binding protein
MKKISELLAEHSFFKDLPRPYLDLIAGCGRNMVFKPGKYLAREGDAADSFFIVRAGKVAIQTHAPGSKDLVLETLGSGEVIGWSWLVPPYKWVFEVQAVEEAHVVSLDGKCLREKAEKENTLGYLLMKKFAVVLAERLRATRFQLLDLYGEKST